MDKDGAIKVCLTHEGIGMDYEITVPFSDKTIEGDLDHIFEGIKLTTIRLFRREGLIPEWQMLEPPK